MGKGNEEELYKWKQEESVKQEKEKETVTYTERADMLVKGQYQYSDDGSMKDAKRTTKKSGYMYDVTEAIKQLDITMSIEASPEEYRETVYKNVVKAYKNAAQACENYLLNRNPWTAEGKARKKMVQDLYVQIQMEYSRFTEMKDSVLEQNIEKISGAQILQKMRTPVYKTEEGTTITLEKTGTKRYYVIEKEGEQRKFKKFEGGTDNWESVIKKWTTDLMAEMEQAGLEGDQEKQKRCAEKMSRLKTLQKAMKGAFGSGKGASSKIMGEKTAKDILKKIIENGKTQENKAAGAIEEALKKYETDTGTLGELEENLISLYEMHKETEQKYKETEQEYNSLKGQREKENAAAFKLYELSKKLDGIESRFNRTKHEMDSIEKKREDTGISFVLDVLEDMKSALSITDNSTKIAKIDKSEDLAKRNVAAARIAKMLDLNGIIPESEIANVEINGKNVQGVFLNEKEGDNLFSLTDANAQKKVSALFNLTSIQILDLICGQVGRSLEDYRVNTENNRMISAVNNELSFGKLTYKDIQKGKEKGYNNLQNINIDGQWTIPIIDANLVIAIRNITPGQLNYELMDLLNKEERDCLVDRFSAVQELLLGRLEKEKEMRGKGDMSNVMILFEGETETWRRSEMLASKFDSYLNGIASKW